MSVTEQTVLLVTCDACGDPLNDFLDSGEALPDLEGYGWVTEGEDGAERHYCEWCAIKVECTRTGHAIQRGDTMCECGEAQREVVAATDPTVML